MKRWKQEALPWADIRPYIEKHASWDWRLGETPKFDLEVEERFPWGNAQLLFTLRHTRVEDVRVFTDALDTELADGHPRPPARLPLRFRTACAGAGGFGQAANARGGRVPPRAGAVRRRELNLPDYAFHSIAVRPREGGN